MSADLQSNYVGQDEEWNDGMEDLAPEEVECKRCHGLGEDRDGADCIPCDGYGSILR